MKLTSWGQYPKTEAELQYPERHQLTLQTPAIPRGAGRSYGDSALAPKVISSDKLNRFIAFDAEQGLLTCDAGVSLDDILRTFVPKGWFLYVTPGTKFITVGGAIASDVHGKNHHLDGCFSEYVESFRLLIAGQLLLCSRTENADLFYATCGGMGLTGFIVDVSLKLKSVSSAYIRQTTIKTQNLAETLAVFESHHDARYSVAWIDCLSTGDALGRSLVTVGDHESTGELIAHPTAKLNVPFDFPSFVLNPYSIQAFNHLYYGKERHKSKVSLVHYNPFFYPLDGINHWNRMYGSNGFTQYQFVIPKSAGLEGLTRVLNVIAESKQGSFLAVLKVMGAANKNPLSFPIEGYTLALDFKMSDKVLSLLNRLDDIVAEYGGRLYLTKDARMSESMFKSGYPQWQEFNAVRDKYGATEHYQSLQSQRLGI